MRRFCIARVAILQLAAGMLASGCGNDGNREGDAEDTAPFAICGDGVLSGDEACDDGNTKPGDGCSSRCELAGTKLGCTTLLEGSGSHHDDVEALLPLAEGSFLAGGALELEGERVGWIGRYGEDGERQWLVMPTPLGTAGLGARISDLAEDPSAGYWALLDWHGDRDLLHFDAAGQIDRQLAVGALLQAEGLVEGVNVHRMLEFDGRLWLAGAGWKDHEVEMWLAVLEPGGETLTTVLFEDYAGYNDGIRAIAHSETELAVAATGETSTGPAEGLVLFPNSDAILIRFDREGSEIERRVLSEQPTSIATRVHALAPDGEGGWLIGAEQYDSASSVYQPNAWVTRAHPTEGWTWTSPGPYETSVRLEDLVVIHGEAIVVGSTFADPGRHPWIAGLDGAGQLHWQRHELDAGFTSGEELVAVRSHAGRLQVAGVSSIADAQSVLRACTIAQ